MQKCRRGGCDPEDETKVLGGRRKSAKVSEREYDLKREMERSREKYRG